MRARSSSRTAIEGSRSSISSAFGCIRCDSRLPSTSWNGGLPSVFLASSAFPARTCWLHASAIGNYRIALNTADLTATDGMMLVRLCRRLGAAHAERVYGPDVMLELCRRSPARGYRHFFYGGAPGVGTTLAARLQEQFPGLSIVGTCSPPFRPLSESELAEDIRLINDSQADVVWIGLGTPKQEIWVDCQPQPPAAPLVLARGRRVRLPRRLRSSGPPVGARGRR